MIVLQRLQRERSAAAETLTTSAPDGSSTLDYWTETNLPSVAILFLLPLIALYEFVVGSELSDGARNAADVWMRNALAAFGLVHPFVLPGLLLAGLMFWHWKSKHPFRCRTSTYLGVVAESIGFAAMLILLGQAVCLKINSTSCISSMASFIGAGIYEEVLFRLLVLPASFGVLRLLRVPVNVAWGLSVAGNAILFATAHYLEPGLETLTPQHLAKASERIIADPALWFGWVFRLTAGVAFCLLFLFRGLAVAVGSHVCYDILVGVVMEQWIASQSA